MVTSPGSISYAANASLVGARTVNGPLHVKISCRFAVSISVRNIDNSCSLHAASRTFGIQFCPPLVPSKS